MHAIFGKHSYIPLEFKETLLTVTQIKLQIKIILLFTIIKSLCLFNHLHLPSIVSVCIHFVLFQTHLHLLHITSY